MTDSPIPPVEHCGLYLPGHSIHWIQARLTWSRPLPPVPIEVIDIDVRGLVVAVDGGVQWLQNHDIDRVRAIVDTYGPHGELVGYHALRFDSGHLICVKDDVEGRLEPCLRSSCL